jgi:hypothetical protein
LSACRLRLSGPALCLKSGPFPPGAPNWAQRCGWQPRWRADTALQYTLDWHRAWQTGADMRQLTLDQITEFESAA